MSRNLSQFAAGLVVASTLAYGQTTESGGWRKVGDPANNAPVYQEQAPSQAPYGQAPAPQSQPPYAQQQGQPPYGQPPYATQQGQPSYPQSQGPGPYAQGPRPYAQTQPAQPSAPVPPSLTVPAGTFITVQTQQTLSSDANHPGDAFSATLARPLVVNGVVVAEPGQVISGQVVEAQRAGRIEGTARLRVHLTELTLVDGQQIPVRTQFIGRQGRTSVGRDAGAVAGTTGLGAAIGAAAGWGTGAAIGAGAGAGVGLLGVLLTRGQPSIIYPEETLTFRLEAPLVIDTTRSSQAFRYVQPNEYNQPLYTQAPPAPPQPPSVAVTPVPPPVVAPYPYYAYPYYAPYYGPSFSFFVGRGFYGPGYYRPGYYRGYGYRR